MKFVLVFALIFAINLPCFAQLTVEQVRQIIREELEPIKLDVAEMKGKMATKDELEAVKLEVVEMKGKMVTKDELEAVRDKLEAVRLDVVEMKGKMATKDDIITVQAEVGSKMLLLTIAFITAWITIIAAIITIPYLYGRSDREKVKQLETDVKEFIKLKAEVESLKSIREDEERRRETAKRIAEENPDFAEAYRMIGLL